MTTIAVAAPSPRQAARWERLVARRFAGRAVGLIVSRPQELAGVRDVAALIVDPGMEDPPVSRWLRAAEDAGIPPSRILVVAAPGSPGAGAARSCLLVADPSEPEHTTELVLALERLVGGGVGEG